MQEVYYIKKEDGSFEPVSYYDSQLVYDGFPLGHHLVTVEEGLRQRKYDVDPDRASLVAAMIECRDDLCRDIVKAGSLRPRVKHTPTSPEELAAIEEIRQICDNHLDTLGYVSYQSAHDMAKEVIDKVGERVATSKCFEHPEVRSAWNKFVLTCKLVSQE